MRKKPKLLVIGSLVMDLVTETAAFPAEGETVLGRHFRTAPGGKGANQAVGAAKLGADVTFLGCVGRDAYGEALLASLQAAGVDTRHVRRSKSQSSAIGNIILEEKAAGTANRIIVVPGANHDLSPDDLAAVKDELSTYDMLLLQLEIPMEVNIAAARMAHAAGLPVMLNPAPAAPLPQALLQAVDYLSPNEHEAATLTGLPVPSDRPPEEALRALQKMGVHPLITLGAAGAATLTGAGVHCFPGVSYQPVCDPTTAGDSFISAFCVAACLGLPAAGCIEFANHAAAITVSRPGAQPSLPELCEVLDFMQKNGRETDAFSALLPEIRKACL